MDRRNIAALGIVIAVASPAALAQAADFSPPRNIESPQGLVERNGTEEDAQLLRREPLAPQDTGAARYDATRQYPPAYTYAEPVNRDATGERSRQRAVPPPPSTEHATIDHGLFNRTGPNDFGA